MTSLWVGDQWWRVRSICFFTCAVVSSKCMLNGKSDLLTHQLPFVNTEIYPKYTPEYTNCYKRMYLLLWGKTTDAGWSCDHFGGKDNKLAIYPSNWFPIFRMPLLTFEKKNNMKVKKNCWKIGIFQKIGKNRTLDTLNLISGSTDFLQNLKGRSVGKKRKIKKKFPIFCIDFINKSFL